MSLFPEVVRTERLLLRPFRESDVDDVMVYASDPRWARFLPVPDPYERSHAIEFLASQLALDRKLLPGWAIEHESRVVGGVNLRFDPGDRRAELGYSIAPSLWGNGLVTEAARKVIDTAFGVITDLHRVTATADSENVGSLRVMEKLGMRREGMLREHRFIKGRFVDIVVCGILREEWSERGV